jgi:HAD superfamily hydrolase (TIGR01509 family)
MSPNHLAPSPKINDLARRRYWIFDMDGTLTMAQHDFAGIKNALGLPQDQGILEALAQMEPERRQVVEKAVDDWEYELAGQAQASTGARTLLADLHSKGVRLGVLTRNTKRNALKTLEAAELADFFAFEDILGRNDAPPKPDPGGINVLLERWQGNARAAIMVGDFKFDLEAGRNAGCATIHLDTSADFSWPDLTDLCVSNLLEVLDHF